MCSGDGYAHKSECGFVWRPGEGVGLPRAGVRAVVNHRTWLLESELRSSAGAVRFPSHRASLQSSNVHSLKWQIAFQRDSSGLYCFPLLCSVPVLFVIPSQFLGQVIRTWTPDKGLQAGKVVIAPAVSNTQGFLPRSGGQVAYSCFLFHSLAVSICPFPAHFLLLNL